MTTVKKCPHCGSKDIKYFHRGESGFYECSACGYKGSHISEEEEDRNPRISW